jgi:hypothetical protein
VKPESANAAVDLLVVRVFLRVDKDIPYAEAEEKIDRTAIRKQVQNRFDSLKLRGRKGVERPSEKRLLMGEGVVKLRLVGHLLKRELNERSGLRLTRQPFVNRSGLYLNEALRPGR